MSSTSKINQRNEQNENVGFVWRGRVQRDQRRQQQSGEECESEFHCCACLRWVCFFRCAYTISSRAGSQRTMRFSCWAFSDMRNVAVSMNASSVEHFGVPRLRMQFSQSII